jgi:hypothetical protein
VDLEESLMYLSARRWRLRLIGMAGRTREGMLAAAAALVMIAGCAGSQAGSQESTPPAATAAGSTDSRVERERPESLRPTRVYSHDELEQTGEADLGRGLSRAGHTPR